MVKTLQKSSSPEPAGRFFSGTGTPWSDLDLFYGRSNLVTYAFLKEKVKTVDFSETIAASDLKVGRSGPSSFFVKWYGH